MSDLKNFIRVETSNYDYNNICQILFQKIYGAPPS